MADLSGILNHCREWAARIRIAPGADGVFIFGSTIHQNGAQFNSKSSDLDIAIQIPASLLSAPTRTEWLVSLQSLKYDLELSLIPLLRRSDASKAIVSIVPFTSSELSRDIHKEGARDFFRTNPFMDLLQATSSAGPLLNQAPLQVDDLTRQVNQFAQSIRNKFLAVSASRRQSLQSWDDQSDPMPKELMRMAAMASSAREISPTSSKFDVQAGLDEITDYIYARREAHPSYSTLHNWISVRRGGRGEAGPLTPEGYLLLTESILDMCELAKRSRKRVRRPKPKALTHSPGISRERDLGQPSRHRTRDEPTRINGYKLCYFRLNNKWPLRRLARTAGLTPLVLGGLERVEKKKGAPNPAWFSPCSRQVLDRLEEILDCRGKLEVGKPDDFLTQYMMFYETYKGSSPSKDRRDSDQLELCFLTKVVVFDFDGTLTQSYDNKTTWEKIWVSLGYSTDQCFDLHRRFQRKEFSHQEWCNMTRDAFRIRQLNKEHIRKIATGISLVDGVADTVSELRKHGIKLFILSGSIKSIIQQVLGDLRNEFEEIKANEFVFDSSGIIKEIQGTPYDFQGKAVFLRRVIEDLGLAPSDVLFVGNSCNDVFASQSGVRTLCVNARFTDPDNEEHWTYAIREMVNLNAILKFVRL